MRRILSLLGVGLMAFGLSGGSAGGTIVPFDASVTVTSSTTLASGGALDWHGRSYIRRRPDGVLVMVYRAGTIHWSNDAELRIRFSDDDGATWTAVNTKLGGGSVTGFPMNPGVGNIGLGEGIIEVAPSGRLVILMWSMTGTYPTTHDFVGTWQSYSDDDGESWSTPSQVTFVGNPDDDNYTFATDDSFVFDRTMYVGARVYYENDGAPSASVLMKSADNGSTWEYVSTIQAQSEGGSGGQEVGLEYLGNSTIIAMLRDNPQTNFYQRYSYDMGATWGTLLDVSSTVGIAGRQRVYTRSHLLGLDGWWKDPVLYMCGWVHQTPGSSADRRSAVWISPDRGITWDGPHYVNTTTDDGGYGDIFWDFTNDRLVLVTYAGTTGAASLIQYNLTLDLTP
jgi:hypothetical protein